MLLPIMSLPHVIKASSDEGLTFRIPPGCSLADCGVLIRITKNSDPNLLTFDFTATAKAWVAVGFTKTPNMVTFLDVLMLTIVSQHQHIKERHQIW